VEEFKRKQKERQQQQQQQQTATAQSTGTAEPTTSAQQPSTSVSAQAITTPQPIAGEGPLKEVHAVQESEETIRQVEEFKKKRKEEEERRRTPLDGTLTPLTPQPPAKPTVGLEALSPEDRKQVLDSALRAATRAWQESTTLAKKAQESLELAQHYFTHAVLKYARKDRVQEVIGGHEIQVRKTPQHLLAWTREQVEVAKQRKTLVGDRVQTSVDAAGRAAAAKREAEEAHSASKIEGARKAADRAKLAHKTAIDAERQIAEALAEMKQISEEVVRKVDQALYDQDYPSVPVILPLPPPSPPGSPKAAAPPKIPPSLEEAEKEEPIPLKPTTMKPLPSTPMLPTIGEEE
jgi:hypothetical protein